MPDCPCCLGEGELDCRDEDAVISETWTDEEIAAFRAAGGRHPIGVVVCVECGGTGTVSEERAHELDLVAKLRVRKVLATLRAEGVDV